MRLYACDYCKNNAIDFYPETCHCKAQGMEHVPKRVVHDGQDMLEACSLFERGAMSEPCKWQKGDAEASEPLRECIRQLERGGTERGVIEALSAAADRIDETCDGMARAIKVIAYCAYGAGDCDGCVMNGAEEPKITVDETTACDGMSEMLNALGIAHVEKSS